MNVEIKKKQNKWKIITSSQSIPCDYPIHFGQEKSSCLHDSCEKCNGSGIDKNGSFCVHMISCPCPKCSPHSL